MGISVSTYYEWQNRFPELTEAIKKGKAPVDEAIQNALKKRAMGYDYEETTIDYTLSDTEVDEQGRPKRIIKNIRTVKKHMPAEVGAIAFWLKNRRPDLWREKREDHIKVTQADYSLLDEIGKAMVTADE